MPGMFLGTQCRGQKTTSGVHFSFHHLCVNGIFLMKVTKVKSMFLFFFIIKRAKLQGQCFKCEMLILLLKKQGSWKK